MGGKKLIKDKENPKKPGECNFNSGVECFNKSGCNKCGWNPDVKKKRIEAWKAGR